MSKNNPILRLNVGIPGSGKSFESNNFIKNNPNWVIVSRDSFRYMLQNKGFCEPKIEDLITSLVNTTVHQALAKKLNVILDATHVRVKYINEIIEEFKYDADIDYRVFDISVDKAIERDKARDKSVGSEVIKKMYENYKTLVDSFHFQPHKKIERRPVIQPNWNSSLPDAIWTDLDGTLANMNGKRGPYDWDKVHLDDVNILVKEQLDFHRSKGRKIIVVSGRDGACRELTETWLHYYDIHFDELFMRPEGDYRKDNIIKREIYERDIKPKYNILAAYDDRLQVIRELYKMNIFTFSVNQGLIEF